MGAERRTSKPKGFNYIYPRTYSGGNLLSEWCTETCNMHPQELAILRYFDDENGWAYVKDSY